MHKNWVIKRYDQSVTCLADDLQNLGTRSSMLFTPGVLSQTNKAYNKHSTRIMGKTQKKYLTRKLNLRTPVCKKNQIKRSNETQTAKKQNPFTNLDLSQVLQYQNLVQVV